jgi:hypothetical protein
MSILFKKTRCYGLSIRNRLIKCFFVIFTARVGIYILFHFRFRLITLGPNANGYVMHTNVRSALWHIGSQMGEYIFT